MVPRRVVVIEVIQQVDRAIELVEKIATNAKPLNINWKGGNK